MIEFANDSTAPLVREMWKTCFNDSDEFLDIIFRYKYRHENTLIYFENNVAVSSLQMLPYTITFYGKEIPFAYLAGLCTFPEYRKKGYMEQLIFKAHEILKQRNIPLAILVPAEEWLFDFYRKYGYEQVFEQGKKSIPSLKNILDIHSDIAAAYEAYNSLYIGKDFCVQKSFDDFKAIVEDQRIDGFPDKTNIAGMARIMDEAFLLNLYAEKNNKTEFTLKIGNSIFDISNGSVMQIKNLEPDVDVDVRMLCRLLFGYKTDELGEPFKSLFPIQHTIMNQMLE